MTMKDPVRFPTEHGEVIMPRAQYDALLSLMDGLIATGLDATWHANQCGCCYSVHEDVEHPTFGYVVGPDGLYDKLDLSDHQHPEKSEGVEESEG